jgi:hypothetical protein
VHFNDGCISDWRTYQDDEGKFPLVPVRFVMACPHGHLSDIRWRDFCFRQFGCKNTERLYLLEAGTGNDFTQIYVQAEGGTTRKLADALITELSPLAEAAGCCWSRKKRALWRSLMALWLLVPRRPGWQSAWPGKGMASAGWDPSLRGQGLPPGLSRSPDLWWPLPSPVSDAPCRGVSAARWRPLLLPGLSGLADLLQPFMVALQLLGQIPAQFALPYFPSSCASRISARRISSLISFSNWGSAFSLRLCRAD